VFIFEILASGTDFQNTGLLQASAKLAVKYWPGRWNTGHLATLNRVLRSIGFTANRCHIPPPNWPVSATGLKPMQLHWGPAPLRPRAMVFG